ncbi:hypothetical protein JG688_00017157 [Phytophthora aleatoria]|uniref:Uncharacterized protein n=1 Tax=Phytophthora aleatoria TaxID=2496075 RepID=A0A8J5IR16_9STRA|nr:hypothetical protein JG688_00017157 [Phytophthora aleatoria]
MRADELWATPTLAALHRARTRSGSACPPPLDSELHRILSEADEQEVLGILRERFRHEQRITSDDVRLVVRAVASRGGSVDIPPDFPPPFWILEFKRVHGFSQLGGTFTLGLPDSLDVGRSSSSRGRIARVTASSVSSGGSSDDERDHGSHYVAAHESSACARSSKRPAFVTGSPLQHTRRQQQHQQHQRRSMVVNDHRAASQSDQTSDREEIGSSTTSGSENGYDYGSRTASAAMQPARVTDGTATVAAVAAAPSQFLPPSRLDLAHAFPINGASRPVLPSMTAHKSPLPPCGSTMTSQLLPPTQLPQRVPRDHRSRPVMFV